MELVSTMGEEKATTGQNLRKQKTKSEGLLWSVLRAKQLCGLKFRQEYKITPFIVDFACPSRRLVVEIDGEYHDHTVDDDLKRQQMLERAGWEFLRFTAEEVEEDAEAVSRAIAKHLGLEYKFERRKHTGSGQRNINAKQPKKRPNE